ASNIITTYKVEFGDVSAAFAKAAHVFKQELWQHRGAAHSIEARGLVAKLRVYSEDVAVTAAAKLTNRSIKWTEDRREYFTGAVHERDQHWALEIAVDAEARVLGVRGKLLHDTGAFTLQDPNIPYNSASTMSGPYIVPGLSIEVTIA